MRVIALIEDEEVVKKILEHLGLWEVKRTLIPVANGPPVYVLPAYDPPTAPTADDLAILTFLLKLICGYEYLKKLLENLTAAWFYRRCGLKRAVK